MAIHPEVDENELASGNIKVEEAVLARGDLEVEEAALASGGSSLGGLGKALIGRTSGRSAAPPQLAPCTSSISPAHQ